MATRLLWSSLPRVLCCQSVGSICGSDATPQPNDNSPAAHLARSPPSFSVVFSHPGVIHTWCVPQSDISFSPADTTLTLSAYVTQPPKHTTCIKEGCKICGSADTYCCSHLLAYCEQLPTSLAALCHSDSLLPQKCPGSGPQGTGELVLPFFWSSLPPPLLLICLFSPPLPFFFSCSVNWGKMTFNYRRAVTQFG